MEYGMLFFRLIYFLPKCLFARKSNYPKKHLLATLKSTEKKQRRKTGNKKNPNFCSAKPERKSWDLSFRIFYFTDRKETEGALVLSFAPGTASRRLH